MDGLFLKLLQARWCSSAVIQWAKQASTHAAQMSFNWELLAQKNTHSQARGGLRPFIQPCPLSLMSLNDYNIQACHNLANTCQFSVKTRPIGYLPRFDLRSNEDVQFNISVNHHSKASESESKGRVNVLVMISSSTSGNKLWHLTCWSSEMITGHMELCENVCIRVYKSCSEMSIHVRGGVLIWKGGETLVVKINGYWKWKWPHLKSSNTNATLSYPRTRGNSLCLSVSSYKPCVALCSGQCLKPQCFFTDMDQGLKGKGSL